MDRAKRPNKELNPIFAMDILKLVKSNFHRRPIRSAGYEVDLLYLACPAALVLAGRRP
jgi:hypothetical protein